MRVFRVFLILLMAPSLPFLVYSQEDTTKTEDDFEYLFKFKNRSEDNNKKKDTLSLADFYEMSLEELENLKATGVSSELEKFINSLTSVSTQKSLPSRYSPNIVTLVTREEIMASGARDMIDVLQLVPGFNFAQDAHGNVGLGIRGNWAAEGKALIMIDGKEINEHYTAHTYFGNHFPIEFIERVEVVRGPGSSVHGGFAEFGVINIVTLSTSELDGILASTSRGRMNKNSLRDDLNLYVARKWNQTDVKFFMRAGNAQRSTKSHFGFYDCTIDSLICQNQLGVGAYSPLGGQSDLNSVMTNIDLKFGNFRFSNLMDIYQVTDITTLDSKKNRPLKYGLLSLYNELEYKIKLKPNLSITPKINFNIQTPIEVNTPYSQALSDDPDNADSLLIGVSRIRMRMDVNYDLSYRVNLLGGMDFFSDGAVNTDTIGSLYKGESPKSYSSTAFYGEAIFKLPIFHLFAGARYETNAQYKAAFSPRIGITRKFNKFHLKFLVTDAYRLPTLGNLYYSFDGTYEVAADSSRIFNVGRALEPEKTLAIEAEAGYQFSDNTLLTINAFDMTTRNPIVFSYFQDEAVRRIYGNESGFYVYQNFGRTGTRGFEIDFRFQDTWGHLNANYSFYSVKNKSKIDAYSVSTFNRDATKRELVNESQLLAFPKHKVNISWLYNVTNNLTFNVTSSFIGARYGYDVDIFGSGPYDVDGKLVKRRFTNLTNFYFRYNDLLTEGLSAGVGVYDIFNTGYEYFQPYFGVQPPMPGTAREFTFKFTYQLPFSKILKK